MASLCIASQQQYDEVLKVSFCFWFVVTLVKYYLQYSMSVPLAGFEETINLKLCLLTSGSAEADRGENLHRSAHSRKTPKTRLHWLYARKSESRCQGAMLCLQARKMFWTLLSSCLRPCVLVPHHLSGNGSISRHNKHQANFLSRTNAAQRHSPPQQPGMKAITLHQRAQNCSSINPTAGTVYGCT